MIAAAVQLVVLMALFTFIERRWPSSPVHKWWRRPLLVDICAWLIHPLCISAGITLAVISPRGLTALSSGLHVTSAVAPMRAHVMALHPLVQLVFAIIVADFLAYWIHRAYHHFSALWAFHIIHHTSEELDWLSTSRLHPVSQIIDTGLVGVMLLGAGFSVSVIIAANVFTGAAALLAHANVNWTFGFLQHLFVSQQVHQWHHARLDNPLHDHGVGNFGAIFSIWDRLFGTWSVPLQQRPERFGVSNAPEQTIAGLALHPLKSGVQIIGGLHAPPVRCADPEQTR